MADVESKLIQMLKNQRCILRNQKMLLKEVVKSYDPEYSDANAALLMRLQLASGMTDNRIKETEELLKT